MDSNSLEKNNECCDTTLNAPQQPPSNVTASDVSQPETRAQYNVTNEVLLESIKQLEKRLSVLEKENHELKAQLLAEQISAINSNVLAKMFHEEQGPNIKLGNPNVDNVVSDILQRCKDPISECLDNPCSTKDKPICLDAGVEFSEYADEVP
ncbi:hypothetical protein RIF29_08925 [Crotalaria pallida]|uniref:Uncharacterized protein n=1 Tax=Crotalaria pallida TaxID=3830 RepID=A0AAN9FXL0_CROPI